MENLYKLYRIHCHDLLVLEEMEYNGMVFASKEAREYANELQKDIDIIVGEFNNILGSNIVNISSPTHLSAVLYGGTIIEVFRVAIGYYKTGQRKGEVKYGKKEHEHVFPRLVEPLPKSETAKSKKAEGEIAIEWSVSEDVLKQLKSKGKARELIKLILSYRGLEKLRGTYLEGYSNLIDEMHWPKDMLHGNLNQCTVITGRLSSTSPNLQNTDPKTKKFLRSRYA